LRPSAAIRRGCRWAVKAIRSGMGNAMSLCSPGSICGGRPPEHGRRSESSDGL
jgi:hypothetical protein